MENRNQESEKLKPCPFCNKNIEIGVSDDEGNIRTEAYELDPWSGLSFHLKHELSKDTECPIATHEDEMLGAFLYDDRNSAIKAWNSRIET